jgi:hypothetical protein
MIPKYVYWIVSIGVIIAIPFLWILAGKMADRVSFGWRNAKRWSKR